MHARTGNATTNSNSYITHDEAQNGRPQHRTPDYDYINVDTLDVRPDQPQDTELDSSSMDGPYSTMAGPAVPNRNYAEKTTPPVSGDVVMVDNDDYEGIGAVASGTSNPGKSDEVVMVENADYEGIGTEQKGGEDNGKSDEIVMVENADYEGIGGK